MLSSFLAIAINPLTLLQAHVHGDVVRCVQHRLLHLLSFREINWAVAQPVTSALRLQRALVSSFSLRPILRYQPHRQALVSLNRRLRNGLLFPDHVSDNPIWHKSRFHCLRGCILSILYLLCVRIFGRSVDV